MSRIKSNFDYLFVIIYFSGAIFFQTRLSENVLLNIHGNTKFWDTYFEIIYYGIFAVACLLFYKNKRGIIRMCEQVAASGNTLILYSA